MSTAVIVAIAIAAGFGCGLVAAGLWILYWMVRCWLAGLEDLG